MIDLAGTITANHTRNSGDIPAERASSPTSLGLLVPDGIVYVTFSLALTEDQSVGLLRATEVAESVAELEESIRLLAAIWGIVVAMEVVTRSAFLTAR